MALVYKTAESDLTFHLHAWYGQLNCRLMNKLSRPCVSVKQDNWQTSKVFDSTFHRENEEIEKEHLARSRSSLLEPVLAFKIRKTPECLSGN